MKSEYGGNKIPNGIRSRLVRANGIFLHVLEAGFETYSGTGERPLIMLIHGFPELAYSWRNQIGFLAEAGYHVLAPDLRGYGRSWGADVGFDDDLFRFTIPNHVADMIGLVQAAGHRTAAAVVGHDFGSSVAAWCALIRPDVFSSLAMMSAPFAGPPPWPADSATVGFDVPPSSDNSSNLREHAPGGGTSAEDIHQALAALSHPRKHYQKYYATREANDNMWHCPQGVRAFLRAYYHYKSADWKGNKPFRLASWSADELAKMPTYYIMDYDKGMAETVAEHMPSKAQISSCRWLTQEELEVYGVEYERNGFQGGLQNYRIGTDPRFSAALRVFANRKIEVPSTFVSGVSDWGRYQKPGALETMADDICTKFQGSHLVDDAGHWVQQEQPQIVNGLLLDFIQGA